MPKTDADVAVAGSMAKTLGLRYRVLDVGAGAEPKALDLAIREATTLSHGRAIVTAYRRAFRADTIHIRSNIGEVGRCFYRSMWGGASATDSPIQVSADLLARLWAHGTPSQPILDAFDDWIEATGFGTSEGWIPSTSFIGAQALATMSRPPHPAGLRCKGR